MPKHLFAENGRGQMSVFGPLMIPDRGAANFLKILHLFANEAGMISLAIHWLTENISYRIVVKPTYVTRGQTSENAAGNLFFRKMQGKSKQKKKIAVRHLREC